MERSWMLTPATAADADWLADLRAAGLRADLERHGRWDHARIRANFIREYVPANTDLIVWQGKPAGAIAIRPEPAEQWLEHFYLDPALQGRGIGGDVLRHVLREHRDARPYRLVVIRGSRVLSLYERVGFRHEDDHKNGVDAIMQAPSVTFA